MLQSGARAVGVGLGAGVGGDAGAEGRRLCGRLELEGLIGVSIGRGAPERESLLCLRVCAVGELKLAARTAADDEEAEAEAAMSVSESTCKPEAECV